MLDLSTLEEYDSQQMYKIYDIWPEIAQKSFEAEHESVNFENVKHIVIAGMGGSGAIGDMFASILSKSKIYVNVVKGYTLPQTVNSDTLVIIISVSGNTDETLSVLRSAHQLDCKIITFSSGGKMKEYCEINEIEYRCIPQYHSPRASFTSYLYTILKVLHSTFKIKQEDITESIMEMKKTRDKIMSSNLSNENPSLKLAKSITGIPVIYHPFGLQSVAIRFKNSLQENAKIHAMVENIVETCHNGIVSWEKISNVQPILIQGENDFIKTKERWKIIKEYFKKNEIEYHETVSVTGSILSKIINLIYVLDYSSIYLSVMNKIDPTPVKSIKFVKSKL
jgi:glucose/mannose-6-phosphate isomerase